MIQEIEEDMLGKENDSEEEIPYQTIIMNDFENFDNGQ